MVAAALRDDVAHSRPLGDAAGELAEALAAAGPAVLDPARPEQRERAVTATLQASLERLVRRLGQPGVDRYTDLAPFPEDADHAECGVGTAQG